MVARPPARYATHGAHVDVPCTGGTADGLGQLAVATGNVDAGSLARATTPSSAAARERIEHGGATRTPSAGQGVRGRAAEACHGSATQSCQSFRIATASPEPCDDYAPRPSVRPCGHACRHHREWQRQGCATCAPPAACARFGGLTTAERLRLTECILATASPRSQPEPITDPFGSIPLPIVAPVGPERRARKGVDRRPGVDEPPWPTASARQACCDFVGPCTPPPPAVATVFGRRCRRRSASPDASLPDLVCTFGGRRRRRHSSARPPSASRRRRSPCGALCPPLQGRGQGLASDASALDTWP